MARLDGDRATRGPARPGPRDGSRRLMIVLLGVIVGLIGYVAWLSLYPRDFDNHALWWVGGGALLGIAAAMLWPGRRGT